MVREVGLVGAQQIASLRMTWLLANWWHGLRGGAGGNMSRFTHVIKFHCLFAFVRGLVVASAAK